MDSRSSEVGRGLLGAISTFPSKEMLVSAVLSSLDNENSLIFHAGTLKKGNNIYAIGGRVLNFVSLSDNFSSARNEIQKSLRKLNWSGGFYRRDIGYKVIK